MNTILIMMLSMFVLIAGLVVISGIPAMMVVTGYRKNQYWIVAFSVAIAALFAGFINIMAGLCALLVVLPFSYVILYCMMQKIQFFRSVLIAMLTFIIATAAVGYLIQRYTDGSILDVVRQYSDNMVPVVKEYAAELFKDLTDEAAAELTFSMVLNTIPAILVCFAFSVSLMTYSFAASYINKKCEKKVLYRKFSIWEPPAAFGCLTIIAMMILFILISFDVEWADPIAELIFTAYLLMLTIKGASCFFFYQNVHKMPDAPAWVITVILACAAPLLFTIIGFIDGMFRLRFSYMLKHGMIAVKKQQISVDIFNRPKKNSEEDDGRIIFDDDERIINDEPDDNDPEKDENAPEEPDDEKDDNDKNGD